MKHHSELYRFLPSVSEVDRYLKNKGLGFGKAMRAHVEQVLEELREEIATSAGDDTLEEAGHPSIQSLLFSGKEGILEHLAAIVRQRGRMSMRRVINATGVVIHTNLGRAPLSLELLESVTPLLTSYATIEYDLKTGKRGRRGEGIKNHLRLLSGAEDALVVNNNAAAVYLMLMALACGKEVVVSRGELIEIGGSFRIPDIMRAAGVRLVEVGTTNRTRLSDYEKALNGNTAALMKIHPSNYRIRGFVEETTVAQVCQLARQYELFSFHDLGSGNFYQFDQPALRAMPTVQQEVRKGVDLLTFSGDKLLGANQAGIVVWTEKSDLPARGASPLPCVASRQNQHDFTGSAPGRLFPSGNAGEHDAHYRPVGTNKRGHPAKSAKSTANPHHSSSLGLELRVASSRFLEWWRGFPGSRARLLLPGAGTTPPSLLKKFSSFSASRIRPSLPGCGTSESGWIFA